MNLGVDVGTGPVSVEAMWHSVDLMEVGEVERWDQEFAATEAAARSMRQPYFIWFVQVLRGARTLLAGRIEEAEKIAQEALEVGRQAQNQNAVQLYGAAIAAIRRVRPRRRWNAL